MTSEDAPKRLQEFLTYYERGIFTSSEASIRLYELAAFIEPSQLLAMIPERLRKELSSIGANPLLPREDWSTIEGCTVHPRDLESYRRDKQSREDRQYEGLSRLHAYFSKQPASD
ncbi:MAG: hypothetical protein P4N60_22435 [Verrucomicrobiae bacterium]|nr:hypothetical protein [Verrucomicrobiae bacterium]